MRLSQILNWVTAAELTRFENEQFLREQAVADTLSGNENRGRTKKSLLVKQTLGPVSETESSVSSRADGPLPMPALVTGSKRKRGRPRKQTIPSSIENSTASSRASVSTSSESSQPVASVAEDSSDSLRKSPARVVLPTHFNHAVAENSSDSMRSSPVRVQRYASPNVAIVDTIAVKSKPDTQSPSSMSESSRSHDNFSLRLSVDPHRAYHDRQEQISAQRRHGHAGAQHQDAPTIQIDSDTSDESSDQNVTKERHSQAYSRPASYLANSMPRSSTQQRPVIAEKQHHHLVKTANRSTVASVSREASKPQSQERSSFHAYTSNALPLHPDSESESESKSASDDNSSQQDISRGSSQMISDRAIATSNSLSTPLKAKSTTGKKVRTSMTPHFPRSAILP